MKDTRDTYYSPDSGKTEFNTKPRFKAGDRVLAPYDGSILLQIPRDVLWSRHFGGWLLYCNLLGVHEQNYILEAERDLWVPHEDGLWSWWEMKK